MAAPQWIGRLRRLLQESDLPGRPAQLSMAPRSGSLYAQVPTAARPAAVMLLLFPDGEDWHFVLIRRRAHPLDPHSAQVGLPGGKQEPGESLLAAAMREMQEETGVSLSPEEVLGPLTPLYVNVSRFLIHPFVGLKPTKPSFSKADDEVDALFYVPLSQLLDGSFQRKCDLRVRGHLLCDVPYFAFSNQVVWGATAMILSEFRTLLRRLPDFAARR